MIKRAKTVLLITSGGYRCQLTVKDSVMSDEMLEKTLLECGGKDRGEDCWFEEDAKYLVAINKLRKVGATANI